MIMYAVRKTTTGAMTVPTKSKSEVLNEAGELVSQGYGVEVVAWDGRRWRPELELTRLALPIEDDVVDSLRSTLPTVEEQLRSLNWERRNGKLSWYYKPSDGARGCYITMTTDHFNAPTKPCDTVLVSIFSQYHSHIVTITLPLALLLAGKVKIENLGDLHDEEDEG